MVISNNLGGGGGRSFFLIFYFLRLITELNIANTHLFNLIEGVLRNLSVCIRNNPVFLFVLVSYITLLFLLMSF